MLRSTLDVPRACARGALFLLCAALAACANQGKQREAELSRIESWFPGQYSNAAQVAEETARGVADAHEPIDLVIVRVSTMMLGKVVFYEAQLDGANPRRVLRQRLHRFEPDADNETITHTVLALRQPERWTAGHRNADLFKSLVPDDVTPALCPLSWKFEDGQFVGTQADARCRGPGPADARFELSPAGIVIPDSMLVSDDSTLRTDPNYRFRRKGG